MLGPLEVVGDDGEPIEVRGAKLKGLLVLLALRAGDVVPVGQSRRGPLGGSRGPGSGERGAGAGQQAAQGPATGPVRR